jgi:hypothetical protein|tara:strand:- start:73 stop:294 length:222 start_codon:yes stop_codon:yes gene_type:complete
LELHLPLLEASAVIKLLLEHKVVTDKAMLVATQTKMTVVMEPTLVMVVLMVVVKVGLQIVKVAQTTTLLPTVL